MKTIKIVLIAVGIVLLIDLVAWLWAGNSELFFRIFNGRTPMLRELIWR